MCLHLGIQCNYVNKLDVKHLHMPTQFVSSRFRNAWTTMKPDAVEDSVLQPDVTRDEVANGEYGLVINGHSLVRNNNIWCRHYQLKT